MRIACWQSAITSHCGSTKPPPNTNARSNSIQRRTCRALASRSLPRVRQTEDALALYNEQLTADPKDRAARAGKVMSLFELDRRDEANRELEAALPKNHVIFLYSPAPPTGSLLTITVRKALDLAQKAVAIESRYTWAQIALGASVDRNEAAAGSRTRHALCKYGKTDAYVRTGECFVVDGIVR